VSCIICRLISESSRQKESRGAGSGSECNGERAFRDASSRNVTTADVLEGAEGMGREATRRIVLVTSHLRSSSTVHRAEADDGNGAGSWISWTLDQMRVMSIFRQRAGSG